MTLKIGLTITFVIILSLLLFSCRFEERVDGKSDLSGDLYKVLKEGEVSTIIIGRSSGGNLSGTLEVKRLIEEKDIFLKIDLECGSACTVFLALDKVCFFNDTSFVFHSIYSIYNKDVPSDIGNKIYLEALPPKLAQFVVDNDLLRSPNKYYKVTGKSMVEILGEPKICK